jgi:hypothetical protein
MKTQIRTTVIIGLLLLAGCTTTQKQHFQAILSTPQVKALTAAGQMIAQTALSVYAPEFAWALPLAVNAASGYLATTNNDQIVATVQSTVKEVANIPAYNAVATQIGNAIAAVHPVDEQQRVAAAQALAVYISDHLPRPKT